MQEAFGLVLALLFLKLGLILDCYSSVSFVCSDASSGDSFASSGDSFASSDFSTVISDVS